MELMDLSAKKVDVSPTDGASTAAMRSKSCEDFHATFNSWIKKCSIAPEVASDETFVDEEGITRYVENWREVDGHVNIRANLSMNGCIEVPIRLNVSEAQLKAASGVHKLSFLMDFRTYWNHLANDSVDEVAEYSPLYRVYMEVFFHRRTIQLMILLTAYNVLVQIITSSAYPVLDTLQQIEFYLYDVAGTFVYLALARLFKGSQIFTFAEVTPSPGGSGEIKENSTRRVMQNPATSCRAYLREAMQSTLAEVRQTWNRMMIGADNTSETQQRKQSVPFYTALNIALKFLSKRKITGNKRVVLNNRANSLKLMFIFLAVPLYCVLWNFLCADGLFQYYIILCSTGTKDSSCKFIEMQLIMTLGSLTSLLQKSIYISAVLLSLMGLHYGAEVGRGLVDSWINRFGMLRRLEHIEREAVPAGSSSRRTEPTMKRTEASVGGDAVLSAMHAHSQLTAPVAPSPVATPEIIAPVLVPELMDYLQRDAYEHYLFIREFMFIGSRAWSPIILTLTFLDIFYVLLFAYNAVASSGNLTPSNRAYFIIWIAIRVFLLTIYPIVSLAHANAYVYVLQEQFLVAAPEDFSVLGGRDSWLQYLEKVPAIWTIYGVLITWDRLTGVLWTGVAALGAVAITYASNNV